MNQNPSKTRILLIFILPFLAGIGFDTYAQNPVRGGIGISFVKPLKKQNVDKVASNVLKIVNETNLNKKLVLKYNIPAGWKMVGNEQKGILIEKGDSAFIPVRVIPSRNAEGNTSYNIGVVVSEKGMTIGGASFTVKINRISNWTVSLPEKKVYFQSGADTTKFNIHFSNKGNATEQLLLTMKPDRDLSFYEREGSAGEALSHEIELMPGQDSIITIGLRRQEKDNKRRRAKNVRTASLAEGASVRIRVKPTRMKGKKRTRSWSGGIHAYSVPSEYDVGESLHGHIPITIEWNTYNILESSTYSHVSLFGDARLKNQQSLTYYYQANFSSNYLEPNTYLGDYHYLGYNSKYFGLEVGNIGSPRNGFMLNGRGIGAHAKYKGHRVEGVYVSNPEIFDDSRILGYGGGYSYVHPGGKFKVNTFLQERKDKVRKLNSQLAKAESFIRISSNHFLRLELGGSREDHYFDPANETQVDGYSYKVDYKGGINRVRYNLRAYVGSENFISYRGIKNYSGQIRYGFKKGYSLAASYSQLDYNPEIYSMGQPVQKEFFTQRDIYQLRFAKSKRQFSLTVSPRYEYIHSAIITSDKKGLNVDYRYRKSSNFNITAKMYAGYVELPEFNTDEFFTGRLLTSVRYNYLSANIRYYYGPYLSREKLAFAETGDNPQRFYANIYYDWWFGKDRFLLKTNFNYNYTTLYNRSFLTTRPELFYYSKSHFRLSIYGRYVLTDEQKAIRTNDVAGAFGGEHIHEVNYEFGFGIKKDMFLPASFKKKGDLEVIAFKDINGNDKQEPDEPGLGDMLISVRKLEADSVLEKNRFKNNAYKTITNGKGVAVFSNMPRGEYQLQATPLKSMGGWYDGRKMKVSLTGSKKLYLPLSKGGRLTGELSVEKADFSRFDDKVNVSNIRVTAFKEDGKSFSALTDDQGKFTLYVPAGKYVVTINEAALGKSFSVIRNNQKINLSNEIDNLNVNFYVVEKQRELKVKRFDKVGGMKPSSSSKDTSKADSLDNAEGKAPERGVESENTETMETETQEPEDSATTDTLSGRNYIPVKEFEDKGEIFTVQLTKAQEERKTRAQWTENTSLDENDAIFCLPSPGGNYIFAVGKFKKRSKARQQRRKLNDSFPNARVIKVVNGNLVKEN